MICWFLKSAIKKQLWMSGFQLTGLWGPCNWANSPCSRSSRFCRWGVWAMIVSTCFLSPVGLGGSKLTSCAHLLANQWDFHRVWFTYFLGRIFDLTDPNFAMFGAYVFLMVFPPGSKSPWDWKEQGSTPKTSRTTPEKNRQIKNLGNPKSHVIDSTIRHPKLKEIKKWAPKKQNTWRPTSPWTTCESHKSNKDILSKKCLKSTRTNTSKSKHT